jgi:hypothetical protein
VSDSNKTALAIKGLMNFYQSLYTFVEPTPLMVYHGVDLATAEKIKNKQLDPRKLDSKQCYNHIIEAGGLASGKTTTGLYRMLCQMVYIPDNLGLLIRREWQELKVSVMADLEKLLELVTDGHPERLMAGPDDQRGFYRYTIFTAGKPSQLLVRPEPDRTEDRQVEDALKGPEYGAVFFDELTQLKQVTYDTLRGRIRRTVNGRDIPILTLGVTNPPTQGQWLYNRFREIETEQNERQSVRTLVVRSKMENNPFVRQDYVDDQKRRFKNDPVGYEMYINGQDGVIRQGTPVFKGVFATGSHVDKDLKPNPFSDLYVGADFGWHNSVAIFFQIDGHGNVNILDELHCQEMFAEQFGMRILDTLRRKYSKIPMGRVQFFGDPAGAQKSDKGDPTFTILRRMGIRMNSRVLDIDPGLNIMRRLMSEMRGGRPRLRVAPACSQLITAFVGGYYFKSNQDGPKPKPHKDGLYDHFVDAIRYGITNVISPTAQDRGRRGAGPKAGFAGVVPAVKLIGE